MNVTIGPDDAEFSVKFAFAPDRLRHFRFRSLAVVRVQAIAPQRIGLCAGGTLDAVEAKHLLVPGERVALDVELPNADASSFCRQRKAFGSLSQLRFDFPVR